MSAELGARWVAACSAAGVRPWARGMLDGETGIRVEYVHAADGSAGRFHRWTDEQGRRCSRVEVATGWPDLADAATVGAAVGILRAWSSDRGLHLAPWGYGWAIFAGDDRVLNCAPTEAEALVAAAEALAGGAE